MTVLILFVAIIPTVAYAPIENLKVVAEYKYEIRDFLHIDRYY